MVWPFCWLYLCAFFFGRIPAKNSSPRISSVVVDSAVYTVILWPGPVCVSFHSCSWDMLGCWSRLFLVLPNMMGCPEVDGPPKKMH